MTGELVIPQIITDHVPAGTILTEIASDLYGIPENLENLRRFEPTDKNIVLLVGASGSGKDEIVRQLDKSEYVEIYSITTRKARPNDRAGSYQYLETADEFLAMQMNGSFMEVNKFGKNYYGTPWVSLRQVLSDPKHRPALDVVDYHGANKFLDLQKADKGNCLPHTRLIYCHIAPPNLEVLKTRLDTRDGTHEERWPMVQDDLAHMGDAHYILVNDVLSHSVDLVRKLLTSREIVGLGSSAN